MSDKMVTMLPKRDEEGPFFKGWAIAFRVSGDEGVLMASTRRNLERMHFSRVGFKADMTKARRVIVRKDVS
jgi:hypothetical protein